MRWTPRFAGLAVVLLVGPGLAPARAAETHDPAKTNSPVPEAGRKSPPSGVIE